MSLSPETTVDLGGGAFKRDVIKLAVLERILRSFDRARHSSMNPRTAGSATGVTLDVSPGTTVPAWATSGYSNNHTSRAAFHVVGGIFDNSDFFYSAVTTGAGAKDVSWSRTDFNFSGYRVALRIPGSTRPYRFLVDDKYVSTGNYDNAFFTASTANVSNYVVLTFDAPGVHKITVESMTRVMTGAFTDAVGVFSPVDLSEAVHAVAFGDSYFQGTNLYPAASATDPMGGNFTDGIPAQLADYLGIYITSSGVGGTGWNQSTTTNLTFGARIAAGDMALTYYKPDIIFMIASINDAYAGQNYTTVQANAAAGLAAVRTQFPSIPIVMLGTVNAGTKLDADVLATENANIAAMASLNDPLMAFVPVRNDPQAPWVQGIGGQLNFTAALSGATSATLTTPWFPVTGTYTLVFSDGTEKSVTLTNGSASVTWTGAVTATAVANFYSGTKRSSVWMMGNDLTHPCILGSAEIARRYGTGIRSALRKMYQSLLGNPVSIN